MSMTNFQGQTLDVVLNVVEVRDRYRNSRYHTILELRRRETFLEYQVSHFFKSFAHCEEKMEIWLMDMTNLTIFHMSLF